MSFQIPVEEIASARNEPLVGGGRLEVTTKTGQILPIISYSLSIAAKFSEAARGIEQLAKAEEFSINLKQERTRCPKCTRLLPEKDGVCPACVNRSKTLLRVLGYLAPYKKQVVILTLFSLITTAVSLVPPKLQQKIIDQVLIGHGSQNLLLAYVGIWIGVLIAATLVQVATGRLISTLAGSIAADLRSSVYRAIEFLQVSYFDKKQVGAITSRVTQDTDRVWGFLVDGLPYLASNALLLIGIIAYLFFIKPVLALAVLSPIPIILLVSAVFWKPMSQMYFRVGQKWARFHMHLNEDWDKTFRKWYPGFRPVETSSMELPMAA